MAYSGSGQRVNRVVLADIFGVSLPTVDAWVRAGCPVIERGGRGKQWVFSTADVMKWVKADAIEQATGTSKLGMDELQRRKLAAETELAMLELAKAKELVAPIAQMERIMTKAFAGVRAGFLILPGRVVASLVGETDERKIKDVLMDEIRQILAALAQADLSEGDEGGGPAEDETEASSDPG